MTEKIYIPFPKKLYDDLIRFSDGQLDVAHYAARQIEVWIDRNFYSDMQDDFYEAFFERIKEFAEEYAPGRTALDQWDEKDTASSKNRHPLIWKYVCIPAGSEVRMSYGGKQYYAVVEDGSIVDSGEHYSPNEWASKIARSARNAWRDLWFKKPGIGSSWEPALLLRQQAKVNASMVGETE